MSLNPIEVTLLVVRAFEDLGVPYVIGGSMASAVHGFARATMDTDIVTEIEQSQVKALVSRLSSLFYLDEDAIERAVKNRTSFNLIHLESMLKLDVFIPRPQSVGARQLARRQRQTIQHEPEEKAYVSSPEDIVLAKLDWYRAGGGVSERQWRDVLGVIRVQGAELDLEYLRASATAHQLDNLLERALSEAED